MGRRLFAMIAAAAAVLVVGVRSQASFPGPAADPFAALPAAGEARPAGHVVVDGKRIEASRFATEASVDEVIAQHRAAFAEAPVDLVEQPLGAARMLSVLDIPGGRHLVVIARPAAGRTEVVRGWSALHEAQAPAAVPLPAGWLVLAEIDDRLGGAVVRHRAALAPDAAHAQVELTATLAAAGWRREPATVVRFVRGGAALEATFEPGSTNTVVQLLLREEESR